GARVDVVHIVGGGARNTLLCQLTADAVGLPVIAGPAEAAAIGNLLVQARAAGAVSCAHSSRAPRPCADSSPHAVRLGRRGERVQGRLLVRVADGAERSGPVEA